MKTIKNILLILFIFPLVITPIGLVIILLPGLLVTTLLTLILNEDVNIFTGIVGLALSLIFYTKTKIGRKIMDFCWKNFHKFEMKIED